MSNQVTSIVKRRVVGSSAKKAVLMYMADNASEDGSGIWTSKSNMAADLETTRRSVQRHISDLMEQGLISEHGKRKCTHGFTVEYCINLEAVLKLDGTRDTMSPVTPRHPTRDTLSPQDVTPCHPNHSGTTQEPLLFSHTRETGSGSPKEPKPKRATSIPENWVPSDKNISDALAKDFTQQEINEQGERFRDYHLAKGSTFKNWDAAWRTWLGNARSFNARRGAVTRPGGFGSGTAQAFADLAREGRDGEG